MRNEPSTLKDDVRRILAWSAVAPALCFWPFLSAAPAFALLQGPETAIAAGVQALLFATGFWGLAGLYVVFQWLRGSGADEPWTPDAARGPLQRYGLAIGVYATLWTGAFMLVAIAGP